MAFLKHTTVNGDITSTGRLILNNSSANLVTNYIIAAGSGTAGTNAFAVDTTGTVYLNDINSIGNTTINSKTGAPFETQAMTVSASVALTLSKTVQAVNCGNIYDATTSKVNTPILKAASGGIQVLRDGVYLIGVQAHVASKAASDMFHVAPIVNGTTFAGAYGAVGATWGTLAVTPRVLTLSANSIIQVGARNYTNAAGNIVADTRTLVTVVALC